MRGTHGAACARVKKAAAAGFRPPRGRPTQPPCWLPLCSLPLTRLAAPSPSLAGYIGEFEVVDDHRAGKIVVELIGRVNKCGVISPRFDIGYADIEQWVVNLLPARQFGHIILTTSMGIMDHEEAKRKHTGGKVLGFFY